MEKVEFSEEQLKVLENLMNKELQPVIIKEIKDNYIPKMFVSELLKNIKTLELEQKLPENSGRKYFLDGVITGLTMALSFDKEE